MNVKNSDFNSNFKTVDIAITTFSINEQFSTTAYIHYVTKCEDPLTHNT